MTDIRVHNWNGLAVWLATKEVLTDNCVHEEEGGIKAKVDASCREKLEKYLGMKGDFNLSRNS